MGLFDNKKINDYKARCQMQIGELEECARACTSTNAYTAVNNVGKIFRSKQNKPYVFDKKELDALFATIGTLVSDIKTAIAKKQDEAIADYAGILAMFLQLNAAPKDNGDALTAEKVGKLREGIRYKSILADLLKTRADAEAALSKLEAEKSAIDAKCARILASAKSGTLSEEEISIRKREYARLKQDAEAVQSELDLKDRTLDKIQKEIAFARDMIAITAELETVVDMISDVKMTVEDFEKAYRRYAEAESQIDTRSELREDIKGAYRGAGQTKRNSAMDEFDAAVAEGKKNNTADDVFRYNKNKS